MPHDALEQVGRKSDEDTYQVDGQVLLKLCFAVDCRSEKVLDVGVIEQYVLVREHCETVLPLGHVQPVHKASRNETTQTCDLLHRDSTAEINLKLNYFEEAVEAFQQCINLDDFDLPIWIGLADVYCFLGDFEDALTTSVAVDSLLVLGLEGADNASLDDWDQMIDTNIKGMIYTTRNILPLMIENGEGHIINLGSVAGSYPYPGGNGYGGTKAFVSQFSLNLRADLVNKGINVTSLEPGLAETEFSIVRFKGDRDKASQVYTDTKVINPENIADAVY